MLIKILVSIPALIAAYVLYKMACNLAWKWLTRRLGIAVLSGASYPQKHLHRSHSVREARMS